MGRAGRQPWQASLREREISLSHGPRCNALISTYIGTIPLSHGAPCTAEQSTSIAPPPSSPVTNAMTAKAGAAASDRKSAAPKEALRYRIGLAALVAERGFAGVR